MENAQDEALVSFIGISTFLFPISVPVFAVVISAACAFLPILISATGFRRLAIWILRLEMIFFILGSWLWVTNLMSGNIEEKHGNLGAFGLAFIGVPLFVIFSLIFLTIMIGTHSILGSEIRRRKRRIEKADR